jgi:drug/metabolite transporter (DMT)-like permease
LPRFIALGLGIFATQVFFLWGLDYTSLTNASIMQPLTPVVTAIILWRLGYERMTAIRGVGILSAMFGAAIVLAFSSTKNILVGNAFLILDCLGLSSVTLLQRSVVRKCALTVITAWGHAFGTAFIFIASAREWIHGYHWGLVGTNTSVIGAIFCHTIGVHALALGIYTFANVKIPEGITLSFHVKFKSLPLD